MVNEVTPSTRKGKMPGTGEVGPHKKPRITQSTKSWYVLRSLRSHGIKCLITDIIKKLLKFLENKPRLPPFAASFKPLVGLERRFLSALPSVADRFAPPGRADRKSGLPINLCSLTKLPPMKGPAIENKVGHR